MMQERWEVNRDKAALRHAMAEFKKNPPDIVKRRTGELKGTAKASGKDYAFEYKYADLDDVISAVESDLAKAGVTLAWSQTETPQLLTVTCNLRYGLYEETGVTMMGPPDESGAKTPIQARISTVSYLRRVTALGALGMAAGLPDTDGAAASSKAPLPKLDTDEAWVERCKLDLRGRRHRKTASDLYNEAYKVINGMKKDKPEDAQSALTSINSALDTAKRRFKK